MNSSSAKIWPVLGWFLLTLALLAFGTVLASGNSMTAMNWMRAQQETPLLWLYDGVVPLLTGWALFQRTRGTTRSARMDDSLRDLRDAHRQQMDELLAQTQQTDAERTALAERNAALAAQISRQAEEARQFAEATQIREQEWQEQKRELMQQAFDAMQGQVSAQGRQLEAVNLALKHHRAEITQLRHELPAEATLSESARIAHLTPAELAAITANAAFLPEAPHHEEVSGQSVTASPDTKSLSAWEQPTTPAPEAPSPLPAPNPPSYSPNSDPIQEGLLTFEDVEDTPFSLPDAVTSGGYTVVAPPMHFEIESFEDNDFASPLEEGAPETESLSPTLAPVFEQDGNSNPPSHREAEPFSPSSQEEPTDTVTDGLTDPLKTANSETTASPWHIKI